MKKPAIAIKAILAAFGFVAATAQAQTNGFNQPGAGPYDYNTAGNWVGGTINGIWDPTLTLAAGQTITFAADTTLTTGLTFNYAGNFALTLDASAAGTRNLTLGGDISLNTGGGTSANVTIGNTSNHLNVNLGGVTRTMTVAGSRTLTLVDVVSSGSITKAGAGTLTLSGADTYTGATTVNGGVLSLQGSLASTALSMGGGTFSYDKPGGGSQSFSTTTLNSGFSAINNTVSGDTLDLGVLSRTAGSGGAVNFTATGTIHTTTPNNNGILGGWATVGNGGGAAATADWAAVDGSGNIITYSVYTSISSAQSSGNAADNWKVVNAAGALTASATINSLVLTTDFSISSGATLTLGSGGLILSGISRWLKNNGNGDTTGTGKLTSGLASGELFVDVPDATSDANNWRIWTKIVDSGSTPVILVKNGPGYVRLENANSYTGGTVLNAGTVFLSSNGSAGGSGQLGGGTVTLNGGTLNLDAATLANNFVVSSGASAIIDNSGNNATLNGTFSGAGTLTIQNTSANNLSENLNGSWSGFTGTLNYTTAGSVVNIFAGAIDLSSATLNVAGNNGASTFRIGGTAKLGALTGSSGTLDSSGGTFEIGNLNTSTTFGGFIIGSGAVKKIGTGTLTLTGANSYSGATMVSNGTLVLQNTYSSSSFIVGSQGALEVNVASGTRDSAATTFSGTGTLTKTGGGTLVWGSAATTFSFNTGAWINVQGGVFVGGSFANENWANNYSGLIISSGAKFDGVEAAVQIDALVGNGVFAGGFGSGATDTIGAGGGSGVFSGVISNSAAALSIIKVGTGTQTLAGANLYTGGTAISNGTIYISADNNLGSGGVAFGGGALKVTNTFSTGKTWTLNTGGGIINIDQLSTLTNTTAIGGSGALTKTGSGTLVLNANNTYSGGTTVNVGTLIFKTTADGTPGGNFAINGGTLQFDSTGHRTFVTGQNFNFGSAGGGVLDAIGTVAGGFVFNSDLTFQTAGGAQDTMSSSDANNVYNLNGKMATFNVASGSDAASDLKVTGNLWNSGSITKTGAGRLELAGNNTYGGNTVVNAGTLSLTGSGTGGGDMYVGNAGGTAYLTLASGSKLTVGQFIVGDNDSGANIGTAIMNGGTVTANNWVLVGRRGATGFFNQTGGTVTNSSTATGYVAVGWGYSGTTSVGTYTLSGNAQLVANSAHSENGIATSILIGDQGGADKGTMILSNNAVVTAANSVVLGMYSGSAGTLSINDNSSFSVGGALKLGVSGGALGTLTMSGGNLWANTIQYGSGSGTITLSGGTNGAYNADATWSAAMALNGTPTFLAQDQAGTARTITQSGALSGSGGLIKAGSGTLVLSSVNTYSGVTAISNGTLVAGANFVIATNSALAIASGATFTNNFQQAVGSIAGAGNIILGASGVLSNGFNNTSTAFTGLISGPGALVKYGTGALTLSGGNTYSGATAISNGTLVAGANFVIATDSALAIASGATFTNNFQQAVGSIAGGGNIILGASGVLSNGFDNTSTAFNGVISGSGGLTKYGSGVLMLSSNTFSGGATISAGTVNATNNFALGGSIITMAGGILQNNSGSSVTITNKINAQAGSSSTLQGAGSADLNLSGNLSGNGNLTANYVASGIHSVNLAGDNGAFAGTFTVTDNGNFRFGLNAATAGSSNAVWVLNNSSPGNGSGQGLGFGNGTIYFGALTGNGGMRNNSGGSTAMVNIGGLNSNTTWSGNISSFNQTIAVTKSGTGTQIFDGNNTYSGGTTISNGTLQIGSGGGAGSLGSGNVANWSRLVYNRNDAVTVGNLISGTGQLIQNGSGTLTLTAVNTYSGATTVSNGTLAAGASFIFTNSALTVVSGATFTNNFQQAVRSIAGAGSIILGASGVLSNGFDNTSTTFSGIISGDGLLAKYGTGTLILSGVNTYTGGTTISNGTLQLSGGDNRLYNNGAVTVASAGTFDLNGNNQTIDTLSGSGIVTNGGAGTVLKVGSAGGGSTFGGVIAGAGALTKVGAGTFVLNGANTYTGGTTLSNGTITVGNNAALGTGNGTLSGGTLINDGSDRTLANNIFVSANTTNTIDVASGGNLHVNGNISGSGVIVRGTAATQTLYLNGNNSAFSGMYTSPVNDSAIIRFASATAGSAGAAWFFNNSLATRQTLEFNNGTIHFGGFNGSGQFNNNGGSAGQTNTIVIGELNGANDIYSGAIADVTAQSLSIIKMGTGTQTFSGTNTYTGATAVNGGTLRVSGMIAGLGDVTVASAGSLSGSGVVSGKVTNAGIVLADSTTPLRLYGSSLYNSGIVTAHNGGLVVSGVFTNAGTVAMMNSVGTFNSAVVNSGAWNMDPSTNVFNNTYTVTSSGYISMTTGDVYIFTNNGSTVGSFINNSTQSNSFNTLPGKVVFDSTLSLTQQFATAGNNIGNLDTDGGFNTVLVDTLNTSLLAQYSNNFTLGTLDLSGISTTEVFDANLVGGRAHGGLQAALFLNTLSLDPGTFLIISNNVQVYFINSNAFNLAQVQLIGNGGLHQLITEISTIPEPNVILLWLSSIGTIYFARRRNRVAHGV